MQRASATVPYVVTTAGEPVAESMRVGAERLDLDLDLLDVRTTQNLASAAERNRLAGIYAAREWADAGGLLTYGPSQVSLYQRAASFVHQILRGGNPAEMPFEQPTVFELVVNETAARKLGLTGPARGRMASL